MVQESALVSSESALEMQNLRSNPSCAEAGPPFKQTPRHRKVIQMHMKFL